MPPPSPSSASSPRRRPRPTSPPPRRSRSASRSTKPTAADARPPRSRGRSPSRRQGRDPRRDGRGCRRGEAEALRVRRTQPQTRRPPRSRSASRASPPLKEATNAAGEPRRLGSRSGRRASRRESGGVSAPAGQDRLDQLGRTVRAGFGAPDRARRYSRSSRVEGLVDRLGGLVRSLVDIVSAAMPASAAPPRDRSPRRSLDGRLTGSCSFALEDRHPLVLRPRGELVGSLVSSRRISSPASEP